MKVFELLKNKALENKKTIVFPEGTDSRILNAAARLNEGGYLEPIVLGNPKAVTAAAQKANIDLGSIEIIDMANYNGFDKMLADLVDLRNGKNSEEQCRKMLEQPSYFGTMLVYEKKADGMVSGATHSTADTVRPALQIIKTKKNMSRVSGAMIMEKDDEKYIFADCAINIDPDSETLAEIAYQSAQTAKMLKMDPKVAMLSFSTKGSAQGPMVEKVVEATEIMHEKHPEIACDGELQFDAAFVPAVGESKAPGSSVAGHANVFIFPELQSGNIAYKVAQRMGNYQAVGPVLQGLAAPINDLSRGASSEDVFLLGILTAAQANME
ncbi:phosphate acetyltransferase [uncultured Lactobacillus sp.]|uniref:phosphate acetyltransferase n=1 Tax=uncultured Lactobacillus sp. TaxID=153152 RepID=UPI002610CD2F|nr:phosphate acetyltransferase [uncultured Lactobacillus sp.]